jgi:hypothetical protein
MKYAEPLFVTAILTVLAVGAMAASVTIDHPHFRLAIETQRNGQVLRWFLDDVKYKTLDDCIAAGDKLPDPPPGWAVGCLPEGPHEIETQL